MAKEDTWHFSILLYRFLENESIFADDWEYDYNAYPWEVRAELKGFQAVLNAFTDGKYNISTNGGRRKIWKAFMTGFGRGEIKCTEEQLEHLSELFPYRPDIFEYWRQHEKPTVGELYEVVFAALAHGFRYITLFSHYPQESLPFKIIERFKAKEIDDRVDDLDDTLIHAIIILLGPDFERKISRAELIQKYGYPKVLD